ncbi:hypothetical protein [Porphyromonas gingivalis]|uniref:hypothetical protein n=1 Tax=Porphyromonas gingivalis TaxID=837 RepID=UPI000B6B90FB|nr:hypothetical protein [Porphyromonas gingivalis]OWR79928.1 hypothetical protein SJDPG11_04280 [Porphyromonas gingivalis SJD11]
MADYPLLCPTEDESRKGKEKEDEGKEKGGKGKGKGEELLFTPPPYFAKVSMTFEK